MPHTPHQRPTPAAYQRAHSALCTLPHWPATVEAALRQPYAAATLRLAALAITRGGWGAALAPLPPHDGKRAAAGDA